MNVRKRTANPQIVTLCFIFRFPSPADERKLSANDWPIRKRHIQLVSVNTLECRPAVLFTGPRLRDLVGSGKLYAALQVAAPQSTPLTWCLFGITLALEKTLPSLNL